MALMWPTRISTNPTLIQHFARIVHWAGAAAGVYYLGKMLKYLYDAHGMPDWNDVAKYIILGFGCWFGGRGFRFLIGKE